MTLINDKNIKRDKMPTEKIVTLRGNDKDTWQFVYSESAEPIFMKFDRALDAMDAGLPVTDTQVPMEHAKIYAQHIPSAQLHLVEKERHHSLIKNHMLSILKSIM